MFGSRTTLQLDFRLLLMKAKELEKENKALRGLNKALEDKKQRLKIEEIDEIQQKTMKEMRTLNEQSMVGIGLGLV